jgi:hypothetical protein
VVNSYAARDIGRGAQEALSRPGAGQVLAVFRQAIYLRTPTGIAALATLAAPPGPLHARCAALPACRAGERIRVEAGGVRGTRWAVCLDAPAWIVTLPAPCQLPGAMRPERLAHWARRLGGRGPGLTPAGDDVLAGLLLVASATGLPAEPVRVAVAASVPTTTIAMAFLRWAARGQCIQPAHTVLGALADGDLAAARAASAGLASIGASSGRALLFGIRLGLSEAGHSFRHYDEYSSFIVG